MENINPFWWTVGLLSAWIGGIGLALTLMAAIYWLIRRSRGGLILFLAFLAFTSLAGVAFVVSCTLMDSKWP